MSPRSDLTIRNLTAEQIEEISKFAVNLIGGVVSFSESAIYESADTSDRTLPIQQCNKTYRHPPHKWFYDRNDLGQCPGISSETYTHG